jgi:hypothetical protein
MERRVLGEALVLLPAACAGLKLAGLRRTRALLARLAREGRTRGPLDAQAIARLVAIAARHGPIRARCLSASLTLESLLRRYGLEGELRLGVRRHEGRFEAHAWIEHRGVALTGASGAAAGFAAFASPRP